MKFGENGIRDQRWNGIELDPEGHLLAAAHHSLIRWRWKELEFTIPVRLNRWRFRFVMVNDSAFATGRESAVPNLDGHSSTVFEIKHQGLIRSEPSKSGKSENDRTCGNHKIDPLAGYERQRPDLP